MNLAIMQPYLFPYLGYFQLISAADTFVLLDSVNFIKRGWINRNRILVNGREHLFSIPLQGASQNRLIKDIELVRDRGWQRKLLRTIELGYSRSPYFAKVFELINSILQLPETHISGLVHRSLLAINEYLGINTKVVPTSACYDNASLKAGELILDICKKEGASRYINPVGGEHLYDRELFLSQGIELRFIRMLPLRYRQGGDPFVPNLSIIDVMMNSSTDEIGEMLMHYELI